MDKHSARKTAEFWLEGWLSDQHRSWRTKRWEMFDNYLSTPPKTILDIGCGIAFESQLFHKKYQSKLWLIDGDIKNNTEKKTRSIGYADTTEDMRYYVNHSDIKRVLDGNNITGYKLIDADNIDIPPTQKFDLIVSFSSCGVHYPLITYKDLIKQHSTENTVCIFDLRNRTYNQLIRDEINVIRVLADNDPSDRMHSKTVHFKFK